MAAPGMPFDQETRGASQMAGVSGLLPIECGDNDFSDIVKPLAGALPLRGGASARGFKAVLASSSAERRPGRFADRSTMSEKPSVWAHPCAAGMP